MLLKCAAREILPRTFGRYCDAVICHRVDLVAWRLSMRLKTSLKVWLLTCDPMFGCQWKSLPKI
jgi:hypothetical protein